MIRRTTTILHQAMYELDRLVTAVSRNAQQLRLPVRLLVVHGSLQEPMRQVLLIPRPTS